MLHGMCWKGIDIQSLLILILLVNMGNKNLMDRQCVYGYASWYKCGGQKTTSYYVGHRD